MVVTMVVTKGKKKIGSVLEKSGKKQIITMGQDSYNYADHTYL